MKHRISLQSVFYLAVDGDAQLHTIQINSGGPSMSMPRNPLGYMPTPGHVPMPGQMPMPGHMPMPGQMPMPLPGNPPGYMPSATQVPMPGVPGYSAYPGQTQNSPYLYVRFYNFINRLIYYKFIKYTIHLFKF